ncbi:MAG TPA: VOC family protein [Puia sp.]|nr:VOC family protein [Puia sp.]
MFTMDSNTHTAIKEMSPLILVADLGRAIEFYTTKLGFETGFLYEDFYAGLVKDGYSIHLKADPCTADEMKATRENQNPEIIFSVENIEHLYKDCENKMVPIIQPLRTMPYGREFYIADPDHNIFAFIE